MTFYGVQFIETQNHVNDYIKYTVIFFVLLCLIVAVIAYLRHRIQTKYRDLSIMMFLLLLFLLGVQYTDYAQNQSRYSQSSQMVTFLHSVAQEFHVEKEEVLANSTQLTDGVVVKIKDTYYTVNLSPDQSSYRLTETHLIDPTIHIQE